ncbi:MAG: GspE/PulE family protein [Candidatus Woykebacteria bacterium]
MTIEGNELKKLILKSGFVDPAELQEAEKAASDLNKPLTDVLIERGVILEKFLGQAIAEYVGYPYADLKDHKIEKSILDLIPEEIAAEKRAVTFAKDGNSVKIALENPQDPEALDFIKKKVGGSVEIYFTLPSIIDDVLDQYHKDIRKDFKEIIEENVSQAKAKGAVGGEDLPVVKILDTILDFAASERASDIHIENVGDRVIIRFRVDGRLRDVLELPTTIQAGLITRIKIISDLRTDEHRLPQDGRFRFKHRSDEISVRVSILSTYHGEDAVMRLLSSAARPKTLEDLGLSGNNLKLVKEGIQKSHGMVLSTGPTGSGKTTTLYNLLIILNTSSVNICTIEDPIEYGLPRVNQTQINPKAGLTFASGLRAILRHDPNVILVGEIRDEETSEIAIHAALTGHLVLSSLHTNDAVSTIPRLYDLGAQPYLIGSTLNLVISQRLVARNCPSCLVKEEIKESVLKDLAKEYGEEVVAGFLAGKVEARRGKGCPECSNTGFRGRVGIYEVLRVSEDLRKLIFDKSSIQKLMDQAKSEGFKLMIEDGLEKVAEGQTSLGEVIRAVSE